jgi:excisionase family DNA binding protein
MTPGEVAEMVRVSCKTVMRAIEAGELEASQLARKRGGWRIMPAAVEEWMQVRSNRRRPPRPLPDVSRVEPPVLRRGGRSPASSGSGRLAA